MPLASADAKSLMGDARQIAVELREAIEELTKKLQRDAPEHAPLAVTPPEAPRPGHGENVVTALAV